MTPEEARNVAALKNAYGLWDEFKATKYDFWLDLMAQDCVIHSAAAPHRGMPASLKRAGTRAEVVEFFEGIRRDWRMLHYTIDTYVAHNDVIVARGGSAWENRLTGRMLSTYKLDWWEFRAGKIVSLFDTFDTAAVLQAMVPAPHSSVRA